MLEVMCFLVRTRDTHIGLTAGSRRPDLIFSSESHVCSLARSTHI